MRIEKINDNQIRCTLTHADLAARHLKLTWCSRHPTNSALKLKTSHS